MATKNRELANEKKLYFVFKNFKQGKEMQTREILKNMLEYAEFYKVIRNARGDGATCDRILARLNKVEVNSSTPLLVHQ